MTIRRRYHDWEHFSSIRNLRGPHTGLPNIVETPPPGSEPESASLTAVKEPEKERKKENAKEKGKANSTADNASIEPGTPIKVKLKLPPSTPPYVPLCFTFPLFGFRSGFEWKWSFQLY